MERQKTLTRANALIRTWKEIHWTLVFVETSPAFPRPYVVLALPAVEMALQLHHDRYVSMTTATGPVTVMYAAFDEAGQEALQQYYLDTMSSSARS